MKKIILGLLLCSMTSTLSAQFVARMEVTEPIEGICDENEVYALLPMFDGQEEASCSFSEKEIEEKLNKEVSFLKDNSKHKDKGMIGLIVNYKGELIQCEMDNETKSEELDRQIEAVFKSLGDWQAGKLNGKEVDSRLLFSFTIKKGKIKLS